MAFNVHAEVSGTFSMQYADNHTRVEEGEKLGILESMKMEFGIDSPGAGVIMWMVDLGQSIAEGDLLAIISEETQQVEEKPQDAITPHEHKLEYWAKQIKDSPNNK